MKEHKYRAWETKFQKMYYSHGDGDECNRVELFHGEWEVDTIFPSGDDAGTIPCDGKRAILMQYTSLQDKNGKEIYFDDIYFDDISKMMRAVDQITVAHWVIDKDKMNCPTNWIEVIGNIYETPNLLDQ